MSFPVLLGRQAQPRTAVAAGPWRAALVGLEAGKTHARTAAPDHGYYTTVKDRIDGKRAALSQARRLVR